MLSRTKSKFLSSLSSRDMELTYRTKQGIDDLVLGLNKIRSMRIIVDKNTYDTNGLTLSDRYSPENINRGGDVIFLNDIEEEKKLNEKNFSNEDEFFYYFYTSPSLLLRRILSSEKKEELKYVLCDFSDTVKAMKGKFIAITLDDVCITNNQDIYGFDSKKTEEIINGSSGDFFIFKSILYRLLHAHKNMDYFKASGNRKESFCFQLFIDTHIDLCNYIYTNNAYTDSILTDDGSNEDDFIISAYKKYYPHERRSLSYCGDLPSIIDCIDVGNIWFDIRPKYKSIVSAVIHVIVCKTQSHKCQKRNLGRILYQYFKPYPIMLSLFRLITKVSLLGNYPHCNYRPDFKSRMNLYRVYDPAILNDNIFFMWLVENEQLTRNIAAEYYIYNVSEQYVLEMILDEKGEWANMKKHLIRSMDLARSVLSRGNITDSSSFEKELKLLHQDSLKFITKLKKSNFLDMIVFSMNKYYEKNVINKKSVRVNPSESFIAEPQLNDMNTVTRRAARRYEDDGKLELKWLKCLKISESGYDLIRSIYFDYEMKELADNAISKRLSEIYNNSAYDFHLMRVYFKTIADYGIVKVHNLSNNSRENQIKAKRARMFLMPWEETPENADLEYYCENCRKWATPSVADDRNEKKMINVYSQGFDKKAIYDPHTGKLFCAKQNSSVTVKKLMESGQYHYGGAATAAAGGGTDEYDEQEFTTDIKSARTIRRHKQLKSCRNTELKAIHMFGKCIELGGKFWAYCEVCALPVQYDGTKFNKQGFTCSMHRREGVEDKDLVLYEIHKSNMSMIAVPYTTTTTTTTTPQPPSEGVSEQQQQKSPITTTTTIKQQQRQEEEISEEEKRRKEIDNKLRDMRSSANSGHNISDVYSCMYCGIPQKRCIDAQGKKLTSIRILDDINLSYKYKDEFICNQDLKHIHLILLLLLGLCITLI